MGNNSGIFSAKSSVELARSIAKRAGIEVVYNEKYKMPKVVGKSIRIGDPTLYSHEHFMQELHRCIGQVCKDNDFFNKVKTEGRQDTHKEILRSMVTDKYLAGEYDGRDRQLSAGYKRNIAALQENLDVISKEDPIAAGLLALGNELRNEWQGFNKLDVPEDLKPVVDKLRDKIGKKWLSLETKSQLKDMLEELKELEEHEESGSGSENSGSGESSEGTESNGNVPSTEERESTQRDNDSEGSPSDEPDNSNEEDGEESSDTDGGDDVDGPEDESTSPSEGADGGEGTGSEGEEPGDDDNEPSREDSESGMGEVGTDDGDSEPGDDDTSAPGEEPTAGGEEPTGADGDSLPGEGGQGEGESSESGEPEGSLSDGGVGEPIGPGFSAGKPDVGDRLRDLGLIPTGVPEEVDAPYIPSNSVIYQDNRADTVKIDTYTRSCIEKLLEGFRLTQKVKKYLLTLAQVGWDTGLKSGVLNNNKIHRLYSTQLGEQPRIYKKRQQPKLTTKIAVSLLIDNSGSMNWGDKDITAAACAIGMSEVLQSLKIPHDILMFTTYDKDLVHTVVRDFNESFVSRDKLLDRLSRQNKRLQENADGEAVLWAAERLMTQRAPEKLLIVLSDGAPSFCRGGYKNDSRYLLDVVGAIEEAKGIDVLGIGILDQSVKRYYKRHEVLRNLEELEPLFMRLLSSKLIR